MAAVRSGTGRADYGQESHAGPQRRGWVRCTATASGTPLPLVVTAVGPFLAVTGSSLRGGSVPGVLGVYGAYAAGLTLVVGVLAVAVAMASTTLIRRMRGVLPYVSRLSGVILVLVGLYVAYYGWFEIRLYSTAGGLKDPVIAAAAPYRQCWRGGSTPTVRGHGRPGGGHRRGRGDGHRIDQVSARGTRRRSSD